MPRPRAAVSPVWPPSCPAVSMVSPSSWWEFCAVSSAQLCTVSSGMTAFAVNPATANTATRTSPYRPSRAGAFISAPDGGVSGLVDRREHRGIVDRIVGGHGQMAGGRADLDARDAGDLGDLRPDRGLTVTAAHAAHLVLGRTHD